MRFDRLILSGEFYVPVVALFSDTRRYDEVIGYADAHLEAHILVRYLFDLW